MKAIDGRASATVRAPPADGFPLLAAVDRYPEWNGDLVREVTVPERGDAQRPVAAQLAIHLAFGGHFSVRVSVRADPERAIRLARMPPTDRRTGPRWKSTEGWSRAPPRICWRARCAHRTARPERAARSDQARGRVTRTTTRAGRVGGSSDRNSRTGSRWAQNGQLSSSVKVRPRAPADTGASQRGQASVPEQT